MKHNHQKEERQNTQSKKAMMNDKFAKKKGRRKHGTKC